ncbi:hypothetical protein BSKO_12875 [Bryopsis sp. KO-2023]|nr:hypothetical protein BSKO_12875 [Bryopsis sp. KO-2023]
MLRFTRKSFSTLAKSTSGPLKDVKASLERAVEGVQYVSMSAEQAYLETDAAARGSKREYLLRYLRFAKQELDDALSSYHQLEDEFGASRLRAEEKEIGMATVLGEALAIKYQLKSDIAKTEKLHEAGVASRQG